MRAAFTCAKRYYKWPIWAKLLPGSKWKVGTLSLVIQRGHQNDTVRIHRCCVVPHWLLSNCENTAGRHSAMQ